MDTKEIIEKLKRIGATITEAETKDGDIQYAIDISTIENEEARLVVTQLLNEITSKDDGTSNTSN